MGGNNFKFQDKIGPKNRKLYKPSASQMSHQYSFVFLLKQKSALNILMGNLYY